MPRNDHLNHKPDEEQIKLIESLRIKIIELDELISELPSNRERSLALTKLEEVRMWAVKSVVINSPVVDEINR